MSKHLSHSQCQRAVSRHTTGWSRTFSQIGGIIVWKYPFMHTNGTEEYNIINEKTSNSRVLSAVSGLESNVREHLAHWRDYDMLQFYIHRDHLYMGGNNFIQSPLNLIIVPGHLVVFLDISFQPQRHANCAKSGALMFTMLYATGLFLCIRGSFHIVNPRMSQVFQII
jgi:hypothetical protein